MGNPALAPQERFTYRQYRTWPDEERWELIDGVAWSMSPAPTIGHQRLSGRLFAKLFNFLEDRPCEVFAAPFDVLLPRAEESDDSVDTIVQPDILVVCDKSKLRDRVSRGAPDLIVEILSPSTSKKDLNEKFNLYERHGVREYWVVDPAAWSMWVYRLATTKRFDEGELRERLGDTSPVASKVLDGFSIDPVPLFADLA